MHLTTLHAYKKSFLCITLSIFIGFTLSGCSISKMNLQEGINSFQVQDYRQAFIRLKPEADKGNPEAQYAVGYMYYYGQGVVEDRQRAFYWIETAANAGQPDAIAALKILRNTHDHAIKRLSR